MYSNPCAAPPDRETWAGSDPSVKRLRGRLLVDAEHHGMLQRIQVEPDDRIERIDGLGGHGTSDSRRQRGVHAFGDAIA
jgi:hypothetical protein